jgi:septal ring factor EnvC (AmiA/AmiB activator)
LEYKRLDKTQLRKTDLAGALTLLNEAASALARFPQLQDFHKQDAAAKKQIAQLNNRIRAYETEVLKLRSELEQAEHFARLYWSNFKNAEAELTELKSAISEHLTP